MSQLLEPEPHFRSQSSPKGREIERVRAAIARLVPDWPARAAWLFARAWCGWGRLDDRALDARLMNLLKGTAAVGYRRDLAAYRAALATSS